MDTAQHIVIQVAHGDFAAVEQRLAGYIKPLLSVEALRASWQGIEQQVGAFQELGKTFIVQTQQGLVHVVTCIFERASLDVNVVLNDAGEIIGLTITPVGTIEQQANATYEPPSYAQPERFQEHEIQIGHGTWVLPGTMSIPRGDGPFAAVLLVHGSGPQDRDETIPPNKPFRDLAWGLASQGIAVLRYEKRTKAYAAQLGSVRDTITVKEEVLDDALEAVALLRERPEIDAQQIFVLGHSLGGYLAPRIGEADPQIRASGAGQRSPALADRRRDRFAAQCPGRLLDRLECLSAGASGANAQTADALLAGRGRLPGHARGFPDLAERVGWARRRAIYHVSWPQPPLYAHRRRSKGHSRHLHRGWSRGGRGSERDWKLDQADLKTRNRWLIPFSILSDVIENGSEDVHKKKCQQPVKLLATRQVVISTQIPGHP